MCPLCARSSAKSRRKVEDTLVGACPYRVYPPERQRDGTKSPHQKCKTVIVTHNRKTYTVPRKSILKGFDLVREPRNSFQRHSGGAIT